MFKIAIIESETGWGQRVDEIKEFNTEKEADNFIKKFNKSNNKKIIPAWYMYAVRMKDV